MALHVIVGAGPTGSGTARLLAETGDQVRLLSRRGTGPAHPSIEVVPADANDTARLTKLSAGATTLINCAMPPYDRWPELFPPLAASVLTTAEQVGADLVTVSNVYGYGRTNRPLTADLPMAPTSVKGRVRAEMWQDTLAAHQAGKVRISEVRGGDYYAADVLASFTFTILPAVLAAEPVR